MKWKDRTSGGMPVRIYALDGALPYVIHGAVLTVHGWCMQTWTSSGKVSHENYQSSFDLVSDEPPRPIVDWSAMPAWFRWVAMDGKGEWFGYWGDDIPKAHTFLWISFHYNKIPCEYAPKFSGDWRDSLVERPR